MPRRIHRRVSLSPVAPFPEGINAHFAGVGDQLFSEAEWYAVHLQPFVCAQKNGL